MSKSNTCASSLLKRGIIALIVIIMLVGTVACNKKGPMQSGIISDDYVMDISGDVLMTVENTSDSSASMSAPKSFARAFEKKYPGVKVTVEEASRNTYATRISTGEIGDIFWCDENMSNNYKKNHNALLMLDYYLEKLDIDVSNVYNGALQDGMIDGRLYMVPKELTQHTLIYNKDALTQAGISIPSGGEAMTWDTFKNTCRQLTLTENGEIVQIGASLRLWWSPVWLAFASGWGGEWCDTVNKTVSFISDEKVMQGFEEMFAAVSEGWLMIQDLEYTDGTTNFQSIPNQNRVFRDFATIAWITSMGNEYDMNNIAWDSCPFPAFPVHSDCAGATGFVVYNRTRNVDAAAALALFLLTEEGQRAYHGVEGGGVPHLKSLADETFWRMPDSDWYDKNYDAFVSNPDAAIPALVIVQAPFEIADILSDTNMSNHFLDIVQGTKSLEDVFTELETRCNETWKTLNEF